MRAIRALSAISAMSAIIGLLAAPCVFAQRIETGISRDTIRVGDPFRAVVRIELAPGTDVVLPDSLVSTEDVESAGTVRMRRDSANGVVSVAAAYPLTAWRPGPLPLPELPLTLKTAQGDRVQTIKLPDITVVSVLPADTTNIEAKPPKDVLGGNRVWWPWVLALILALAIVLALIWWWRKRRKAEPEDVPLPTIMPRERALEELERIRKLGLVREGDFKRHYTLVSEVLRKYMSTTEPKWSTDLTTDELAQKTKDVAEAKPAISVLRQADMVKFARSIPDAQTAERDLERTSEWIAQYPAPAAVPAEGKAA